MNKDVKEEIEIEEKIDVSEKTELNSNGDEDNLENTKSLEEKIKKLEKEKEEYSLRIRAEVFNARRDTEKKIELLSQFSLVKLFKTTITLINDLKEKFIKDLKEKKFDMEKLNSHLVGLEMMLEHSWSELFSQGLSKININVGIDKWNSLYHEFAGRMDKEEFPQGLSKDLSKDTIVEVIEDGYTFKDKVVKSAKVKLSSGN